MKKKLYWTLYILTGLFSLFILGMDATAQGAKVSDVRPSQIIDEEFNWIREQAAKETTYAGAWAVHTPNYGHVIAFASLDYETILEPYLNQVTRPELIEVIYREYSLSQLFIFHEEIFSILREELSTEQYNSLIYMSAVNIESGTVKISTPETERLRTEVEAIEAMQPYLSAVSYEYLHGRPTPMVGNSSGNHTIYLPVVMAQ